MGDEERRKEFKEKLEEFLTKENVDIEEIIDKAKDAFWDSNFRFVLDGILCGTKSTVLFSFAICQQNKEIIRLLKKIAKEE